MRRPSIVHHTPLPPAQNGIADYAWRMIDALKPHFKQSVVTGTPGGCAPPGVRVRPQGVEYQDGLKVYQIGNNWHHSQELRGALSRPGLVLLHDLSLLYLYESLSLPREDMVRLARRSNLRLSSRSTERLLDKKPTSKLPYMLVDMLPDLLTRSHRIVVHSQYARQFIRAHHGEKAARKVDVIPHFAMKADVRDPETVRRRLGYTQDDRLIVTAGFAAHAKRFNIIAKAVADLAHTDTAVRWIHAGAPNHGDLDLRDLVRLHPGLEDRFVTTGYLDQQVLDDYVAIADIFLNLRFPSVGESSGSLARALAMGVCTIVSNTASYREIPDRAVFKASALCDAQELRVLLALLLREPELRHSIGRAAADYAKRELDMERYADRLALSIRGARRAAALSAVSVPLRGLTGAFRTTRQTLWLPLGDTTPFASSQSCQADAGEDFLYAIDPVGQLPGAYTGVRRR